MSRLQKGLIFGLATGLLGLIFSFAPFGLRIEEHIGLDILFGLRGPRTPPTKVMIVTMDETSANALNLPVAVDKWPRCMHARLTDALVRGGASVIAFDVLFAEPKIDDYDHMLANAIRNAKNVVLGEFLRMRILPLKESKGVYAAGLNVEELVEPIPLLKDAAAGHAPFPLPKVPAKVSQYWLFKTSAEDIATLPVVAFQLHALSVYPGFTKLLRKVDSALVEKLPKNKAAIIDSKNVETLIRFIRGIHRERPHILEKMRDELDRSDAFSSGEANRKILRSFLRMYQSPNSRHLNFYGPPGSITTIPYFQILSEHEGTDRSDKPVDLKGKIVFVGLSERLRPDQKDGFNTVFSQPNGINISGVEIAATAFANLLEDMPVKPVSGLAQGAVIVVWGLVIGMFCRYLPTVYSGLGIIGMGILYLAFAQSKFSQTGIWYPVTVPLFVQIPVGFFGTVLWKYADTQKERKHIRRAFGYYLPDNVVDQLSRNMGDIESGNQPVHGTCLFTDAGQYTTLSETMDPAALSRFMNTYYEMLFGPVKHHEGIVINVVGDSMLALWATGKPDRNFREKACLAALDIDRKVHEFNQILDDVRLPIRIGLHSGHMLLGSIGAMDHYEYRPIGDIVNTASRMEGLNKYLNTQILVSKEVLQELDGFWTRELGTFRFAGKAKPTQVFELLCRMDDATELPKKIESLFSEGLQLFRKQSFQEAMDAFNACVSLDPDDGPSTYYINLCKNFLGTTPQGGWDGTVVLNEK